MIGLFYRRDRDRFHQTKHRRPAHAGARKYFASSATLATEDFIVDYAVCTSNLEVGASHRLGDARFASDLVGLMPALKSFAYALSRNATTAEDLVQDTSVSALTFEGSFVVGSNMRAWLFRILRNQYYSLRRRTWRDVQDTDGEFTAGLATRATQDNDMDFGDASRAFAKLSVRQRTLLLSVGTEGTPYKSAATESGCALGTIKSRVSRARRRFAEYMV